LAAILWEQHFAGTFGEQRSDGGEVLKSIIPPSYTFTGSWVVPRSEMMLNQSVEHE
jgi:hypothetical protein